MIPSSHADLLEKPNIAHLATERRDGDLQSNPVWYEWDGTHIKVSQTTSRQKVRNVRHNPKVALSIVDPENPYRYLELRGVVDRIDPDPEAAFIDRLAKRYLDQDEYPWHQPGDERVVVLIRPTSASSMG